MRTLHYELKGQRLLRLGDHGGLVAGTEGYLKAKFLFSDEWWGCKKVASFYNNGVPYAALVLNNECVIPAEALTGSSFEVAVEGRRKEDNYRILSVKVKENQTVRSDK